MCRCFNLLNARDDVEITNHTIKKYKVTADLASVFGLDMLKVCKNLKPGQFKIDK